MFLSLPEFRDRWEVGSGKVSFLKQIGARKALHNSIKTPPLLVGGQCGTLGSRGRHHTGFGQPGNWTLLLANPAKLKSENSMAGGWGSQVSRKRPPQSPEKSPRRTFSMFSHSLVLTRFASGESPLLPVPATTSSVSEAPSAKESVAPGGGGGTATQVVLGLHQSWCHVGS